MSAKTLKLQPNTRKAKPVVKIPATPIVVIPARSSKKTKKSKTRVEELMLEMNISS